MLVKLQFKRFLIGALALVLASLAWGFDLIRDSNGYIQPWGGHSVSIKLMLPVSPALSDGNSQSGSVHMAMQAWNANLNAADIQFAPIIAAPGAYGIGNGVNEIVMDSTMDGEAFGQGVLAVTFGNGSQADIIFNSAYGWDSYRGALRRDGTGKLIPDMHRVAIHELGHLLGLDHPDQATPPQSVVALMNSTISDLDALTADDIAGGRALYGVASSVPGNDYFLNATALTVTNTSSLFPGSNVAATKEPGEPNHAGNEGGRSVWWKWTSTGTGSIDVSTAHSNFDTVLGVYRGSEIASLTQVGSNDDVDPGVIRSSVLTCAVTIGTTYYIAVDGWDGAAGTILLRVNFTPGPAGVSPSITSQPANQVTTEGYNVQFSVSASGTPNPGYQWQRLAAGGGGWSNVSNGGAYSGATSSTLTVSGVQAAMSGDQFRCAVSNSSGSIFSNEASLTVAPPVRFTARPLTRRLMLGDTATFQVSATGTGGLSYQWRRNGQIIAGETSATFTLNSAAISDNGFYEVYVTDANGTAHSCFQVHVALPGLTVAGWGDSQYNQLATPVGLGSVVAVAGGRLALKSDGTVVGWGDSYNYGYNTIPEGLSGVVAVAAGSVNAALKSDGTLTVWGLNISRQVEVPAGLTEVVAVAIGQNQSVALKADGKVVTWGDGASSSSSITNALDSIVAVAAGASHGMALSANGTVVTWGQGALNGPLTPPSGLTGVVSIAAGGRHCLALKSDGTVVAWGSNDSGEATVPGNVSPVVAIAAGSDHSLALKADGSVIGWGNNYYGQVQVPAWIGAVRGISAGNTHSVGLILPVAPAFANQPVDQEVNLGGYFVLTVGVTAAPSVTYQWRHNGVNLSDGPRVSGSQTKSLDVHGVLASHAGNYDVVVRNTAGVVTSQVAVIAVRLPPQPLAAPLSRLVISGGSVTFDATAPGDVTYAWSNDKLQFPNTGATLTLTNVAAADAGPYVVTMTNSVGSTKAVFYLRVLRANAIYAWGGNDFGQSTVPAGLNNVADLSAGMAHNLALRADGTVVAWGRNESGQTNVPAGLNNVIQLSAGAYHSVALKADGTVVAWGANDNGQTNVPAGLTNVVQVSAGGSHTVALKSDGTMVAWGANDYSQATVPANMRFTYYVSAGLSHNVALTDGGMAAWGKDNFGQSNMGNVFSATAAQAGADHTLYVDSRGELLARGIISSAPLGTNATAISVRETHGLLLRETGEIVAWGPGLSGENDVPAGVGNGQIVAAGAAHSVVVVSPLAPTIRTQPVSLSAVVNDSVSFTVTAVGAATYRWLRNGVELDEGDRFDGTATATLHIANVQFGDAGNYTVRLTNGFGSTASQAATLQVQSLMVTNNGGIALSDDGTQVRLSVTASGGSSFTYQWFAGPSGDTSYPIAGANTNRLIVSQGSQQDNYWVRVSNGLQSVNSDSFPIGKWKRVDPLFGGAELSSIAYGAGKYVVVGTAVGYSTNAIEWKEGAIEAGSDLQVVLFDGTRFIAGGVRGQVFASDDGMNWQKLRAADPGQGAGDILTSGACGNGITVLASGNLMSSTNGIDWQWRSLGSGSNTAVRSVAFGAGRFVAVGEGSSYQPRIYQSTDGINWSPASYTLAPFSNSYALNGLSQVAYFGGRFIALGQLQNGGNRAYYMTSVDGLSWTVPAFTNAQVSLQYMALGDGLLLSTDLRSSTDGINWSARSPSPTNYTGGLAYGNGVFLVIGSRYNSGYASISTSTDLSNWTRRVGFGIPRNLGYGNGRFVAVNRKTKGYSLDGTNWVFSLNTGNTDYGGVAYGNGLFVSLASSNEGISHFTSPDGITWTPRYSMVNGYRLPLSAIQYSDGQWIGFNSGGIFTSPDALEWTLRYSTSARYIRDMAYGNGRYVVIFFNGGTLVSTDAVSWTSDASNPFTKITYGMGMFVATDGEGLWTSTDGRQWIQRQMPVKDEGSYTGYLSSMEFGGGRFVGSYGRDILSSYDGIVWQVTPGALLAQNGNDAVEKLIYAAGTFWAAMPAFADVFSLLRAPTGPGQPEIVSTPSNVLVNTGNTATLVVNVAGAGLAYQWYRGASGDFTQPIAGANSASYTTPPLTQVANYWVLATGAGGAVSSSTITVSVATAPVITAQPTDADVIAGTTVTLSVVADGVPTPSLQWYAGGRGDISQPIAGATAGSLTLTVAAETKRYWARLSNKAGTTDTVTAVVTPWFERTAIKGRQLGGVVNGNGRWVVSGGPADFYSADGVTWTATSNAFGGQSGGPMIHGNGVYIGTDSDQTGALWRSADGKIWQQIFVPTATVQFHGLAFAGGLLFALADNGRYATSIDGNNWRMNAIDTSSRLLDVAYGNGYFVMTTGNSVFISSNLTGWVESPVAGVGSLAFGANQFVAVGSTNPGKILVSPDGVNWTVRYVDTSNGVYDVAYDGSRFAVAAAGHILLSRDAVDWHSAALAGSSQIAAGGGTFLSVQSTAWQSARRIQVGPIIMVQPVSQAVLPSQSAVLSVSAEGGTLSYQWRKNNQDIPGAVEPALTLSDFQISEAGLYTVTVSDENGSVVSTPALLVAVQAPQLLMQPQSREVNAGQKAFFEVAVSGDAPVQYQWFKDGGLISEQTNARLSFPSVQASDAGTYYVVVTTAAGAVTSATVTLTVYVPPVITQEPVNQSVVLGGSVAFTVGVSSNTPVYYFWQRSANGVGIWASIVDNSTYSGSFSQTLTILSAGLPNNGDLYRCLVTNQAGSVTSIPVSLAVGAAGFTKLSAGRYHSLRVNTVAQVYATGRNSQGQLGVGNTVDVAMAQRVALSEQTITDAAAGAEHSLFLTNVKEVWATGLNSTGQLGDGTTTAKATPIKLATNAVGMAAGNFHSVVLKTDGSLWTVGGNDSGQLGNGTMTDTTTLAQVATSVVHAVAGIRQTLFLKSDGTLWAMGNLDGGDIGVSTPIQIATNVKTMAAGGYHSLFVKTDGTLWAMGYNPSGQLGTGDTTTRTTPVQVATGVEAVSAGYFFSVYLKTDRSLWAMGNNGGGQLGDGTTTARSTAVQVATNVATVATGENYTLFTKTDGTLWGTGYTANGQFGNGTTASLSTPAQLAAGVVLVPEAPTGLTATVATSPERAQLTWTPQGAATSYEVWRHTANDSASATRIAANQRWALYEDLAVTPGQAYYYWVKAVNSAGTSAVSAMATTASTLSQTITFNPLPDVAYSTTPITLSATASSSLPVTFSVVAGPATVTGSSLTLTGVGAVTVRASQAGNSAYDPAPNVARSFAVSKASAAVTLGSLSATYDGTPKSATATTNPSGLTVGFTYDGSATAPMNAGSYAVVGTIADALYQGSASGTLTIAPAAQTITFDPLADRGYTATPISLSATASSGLTVTFSVVTGPATVSGNSLTLNGAGTVTVRAEQVGNASYSAATAVERSFTVTANFDSWRLDHFTAPERADMNVSGPNAVFGQDGLPNLVKYALGLEPKVNDTSGLPEVTTTATDWVYTYMKPATVTDVTLAVEVSADLVTWSTTNVTLELVSSAGAIETWRATYPLSSAANAFFRLRVTQ